MVDDWDDSLVCGDNLVAESAIDIGRNRRHHSPEQDKNTGKGFSQFG
jgi:hypothetical protein